MKFNPHLAFYFVILLAFAILCYIGFIRLSKSNKSDGTDLPQIDFPVILSVADSRDPKNPILNLHIENTTGKELVLSKKNFGTALDEIENVLSVFENGSRVQRKQNVVNQEPATDPLDRGMYAGFSVKSNQSFDLKIPLGTYYDIDTSSHVYTVRFNVDDSITRHVVVDKQSVSATVTTRIVSNTIYLVKDFANNEHVNKRLFFKVGDTQTFKTVEGKDYTMKLKDIEDKRCPRNADCLVAWPSSARFDISYDDKIEEAVLYILDTTPVLKDEKTNSQIYFGGKEFLYMMFLEDIQPGLRDSSAGEILKDKYVVQVTVTDYPKGIIER